VSERPSRQTTHPAPAPGRAGLGAITVIFFTLVAYATGAGVLVAADGLLRGVHGDPGTARLLVGMILLVPAMLVSAHTLRRRSRPVL
jgi:hypothetical protein